MSLFPDPESHAVQKAMTILQVLKACANAGLQCPTNAALAERSGYRSTASVANAVSFLATCGFISVERMNHTRIVTICATGKRTADPCISRSKGQKRPHHSAQINALVEAA